MVVEFETWFHNKTLETISVKVGDAGAGFPNEILFTLCDGCAQWYEVFQEDLQGYYTRDEPVTVDLLERMGWDVYGLGDNARYGATQSISATGMPGDDSAGIYLDWSAEEFLIQSTQHFKKLPQPNTLLDLMNVMRVFGISATIPAEEAAVSQELTRPGEEWFHKTHLTLVLVVNPNDDGDVWLDVPDIGDARVDPGFFLRDYARNEPVTAELLERLGLNTYKLAGGGRGIHLEQHDADWKLLWSKSGKLSLFIEATWEGPHTARTERELPPAATLRDLLVTLRAFGVNHSVTPAAT